MTGKLNFRQRIVHASVWTIGGHASSQALRLISNLLMTRLLMPEAFGIMAIANTFIIGLALFSDVGLGQSVVRSKRSEEATFTNTVWTMQVARGLLICLVALGLALALGAAAHGEVFANDSVYSRPELPWILALLSLSPAIAGLESTKMALAGRALNVKLITFIEIGSQVGALCLMLAWAYLAPSIWVLAVGAVAASFIRTLLTHAVLPGAANHFHWDKEAVAEVFGYGKWIFLSSILGFVVLNGDKLILGGLVDASALGMFSLASFLVSAIQLVFNKLSSSVAFPTFCEVARTRPQDLRNTYYKLRLPIEIASLFAAGFLFAAGHLVANILYDQRYQQVGILLEILSISLLEVRYGVAGQCLMAMGHSKAFTILIAIRLPLVVLTLPAAYATYGLQGAAWIAGGNVLITIPFVLFYKYRFHLLEVKKEFITLPTVLIGFGAGLACSRVYSHFYPL